MTAEQTGAREDGAPDDASGIRVLVRCLDPGVPLPRYALPGDAGADIVTTVDAVLAPGERAVLPTGIAIALPVGYAAFVHPRSGLAAKHGITEDEAVTRHAEEYALRRITLDEDVANACLFMASPVSRQITGVDLPVDGGWGSL